MLDHGRPASCNVLARIGALAAYNTHTGTEPCMNRFIYLMACDARAERVLACVDTVSGTARCDTRNDPLLARRVHTHLQREQYNGYMYILYS